MLSMRSYFVSISFSYWCILVSTCCSSAVIFVSSVSIFSNSPSRLASSTSSLCCVVSALVSCLLLKSSSSSMSRKWDSGVALLARVIARVMFSSNRTMLSCFSFIFCSSSPLHSGKLSMNWVISFSLARRISYFCWSLPSVFFSCESMTTSRICARSFSISILRSEFCFSVATMSALSFLTLAKSRSRCSGTLRLHVSNSFWSTWRGSSRLLRKLQSSW
mmetsp:Transcript_96835/g.224478  ORF Transcript_96835/g.224478 Transcript_96835/m.224478 type:complete len:219 (-) Transcript_96835:970-1626(-)